MEKIEFRQIVERDHWERLFEQAHFSALTQDWAYGEALHKVRGYSVCRSGFFVQQRCLALVQAVKRGLFTRINRGPVWLTEVSEEQRAVTKALKKEFRTLLWAPNERQETAFLRDVGFVVRLPLSPWKSSRIHLRESLDVLKDNLQGKWRNQLSQSHRLAPHAEIFSGTEDGMKWFLTEYRKLTLAKSFSGIPEEIFLILWNGFRNQIDLWLVKELGELVAGGIIFKHGRTATYLAGVNTNNGRRIYAHNRMLWQAIENLRHQGMHNFDLGGVDPVNTPGIAHFKIGMGGENYQLQGEFLCASLF